MIPPELEKLLARLEQAEADVKRLAHDLRAAEGVRDRTLHEVCQSWRTLGEGPGLFDRAPAPAAREEGPAQQAPSVAGITRTEAGLKPPPGHSGQRQGRTVTLRDWQAWDTSTGSALGRVLAETRESALTIALDRYGVPAVHLAILEPGAVPEPPPISTREEAAWEAVAAECTLGRDRFQHQAGKYVHGKVAALPGITCYHKDAELPADWKPTPAQEAAWLASQNCRPAAPAPRPAPAEPPAGGQVPAARPQEKAKEPAKRRVKKADALPAKEEGA
jgi:hypothetical protein